MIHLDDEELGPGEKLLNIDNQETLTLSNTDLSHYIPQSEDRRIIKPTEEVFIKFTKQLSKNNTLKHLDLSHCKLLDHGLDLLGEALSRNKTLRHMDISSNGFTADAVELFSKQLSTNFTLSTCILEEDGKDILTKTSAPNFNLTVDNVGALFLPDEVETSKFSLSVNLLNNIVHKNHQNYQCINNNGYIMDLSYRLGFFTIDILGKHILRAKNNIKILVLEYMELEELPKAIVELRNLKELSIAHNNLKSIPEFIGAVRGLRKLCFRYNNVSTFPDCIGLLKDLEELDGEQNRITEIPISIVANLTKLDTLKLSYRLIRKPDIPKRICELDNRKGKIVLKYLQDIFSGERIVNRCKLMFVGDGGVGKTSLANSFHTFITDKKKTLKLMNKKAEVLPSQERNVATDGIEVRYIEVEPFGKKLDVSEGDKVKLEFSMWDFAGQEVYYATHQFFLNEGAIYIVVCNMEDQNEKAISRIDYWLQSINARAPKAPVIIICTHYMDKKTAGPKQFKVFKDMLDSKFLVRFQTLIDILPVSNDTLKGVDKIIKTLVKICLSERYKRRLGIGERRPISWLALEEHARALRTKVVVPLVSWNNWVKVAIKSCNIRDEEGVRAASAYLHSLGNIVWFDTIQSGLSDTVILDSQWLTEVFSSVVSAKNDPRHGMSGNIKFGILQHKDLDLIWRPPKYPPYTHPFMLAVLEKFEVLHRLEGSAIHNTEINDDLLYSENQNADKWIDKINSTTNEGRSLIPCLLSETRPSEYETEKHWPYQIKSLQIGRYYQFKFLPIGFFSRLIVRLLHSEWKSLIFWKYGIILRKKNTKVKLEIDPVTFFLTLLVRGASGVQDMGKLIGSIDALITDWLKESVGTTITIPCVSCMQRLDREPYLFSIQECEVAVSQGKRTIRCPRDLCSKIRIDQLAPDLAMTGEISDMKLDYDQIKIEEEIGIGGFAVVMKGEYNGIKVAVKKLALDEDSNLNAYSDKFTEFRREVWLMSGMSHENIVKFIGVCMKPLCMVLEYCSEGNLFDYLHEHGPPSDDIEIQQREQFALQIASGLDFLHSANPPIVHRDLKSPNILLTKTKSNTIVCKIADFGLSRGLVWNVKLEGKVVDNPVWLAPEVIKNEPYTEKVDIYSVGIIMWELMSGKEMFADIAFVSQIGDRIVKGIRSEIPEHTPKYYRILTEQCWGNDPNKRPSANQCVLRLNHKDPCMGGDNSSSKTLIEFYEEIYSPRNKIKTKKSPKKDHKLVSLEHHDSVSELNVVPKSTRKSHKKKSSTPTTHKKNKEKGNLQKAQSMAEIPSVIKNKKRNVDDEEKNKSPTNVKKKLFI